MNFSRHSAKNNVTEERGCAAVPDAKALAEFLSRFGITEFSVVEASGLTLLPGKVLHGEFAAALVFLMPYFAGEKSLEDESRISLYARSYDYHILFRRIKLEAEEKFSAVGFCDSSPFAEVVCAASAGLGVIGRNGLLINGEFASLFQVEGAIYTVPGDGETVFLQLTTDWMEDTVVCFDRVD